MLVLGEIMIQGQIDPRSVNAIKRTNNFILTKKNRWPGNVGPWWDYDPRSDRSKVS